ncbi:hypothetical protein [Saccharothrix stipae]
MDWLIAVAVLGLLAGLLWLGWRALQHADERLRRIYNEELDR